MFSYEFCEISKNTFPYRTLPMSGGSEDTLEIYRQHIIANLKTKSQYQRGILDNNSFHLFQARKKNHKQSPQVFYKKYMFLKIWQRSQENTCVRVSFLLKKRPWHSYITVNVAKFLTTAFL